MLEDDFFMTSPVRPLEGGPVGVKNVPRKDWFTVACLDGAPAGRQHQGSRRVGFVVPSHEPGGRMLDQTFDRAEHRASRSAGSAVYLLACSRIAWLRACVGSPVRVRVVRTTLQHTQVYIRIKHLVVFRPA